MTGSADLERRYRRLLAWYPAAFRREHESEMLGVLMASACDGHQRVGLADAADLIRGALTMRLRVPAGAPRTVAAAVLLMYAGAVVTLVAWVSTLVTASSVGSAMLRADPARWHLMLIRFTVIEAVAPAFVIGCSWLAWAIARGRHAARVALVTYFGVATLALLGNVGLGVVYPTADLISLAVLWLVQISAIVLVFNSRSGHYYRPAEGSAS
jgi:hypothetical protein